jgi:hypothetical protein
MAVDAPTAVEKTAGLPAAVGATMYGAPAISIT